MTRGSGKAPSQRQLRVGEALRHALAGFLAQGDFGDPALSDVQITVTEVRVSPDLRNATAFVTPLGGAALEEKVAALNHAAGFIQSRLAPEMRLRYMPRLRFEPDDTFDRAMHLRSVLARPRVRRDLEADDEGSDKTGGGDHGA